MNGIEKMCPEAWCMVLNFVSSVCPAGGRLDLNIHEWYDDGSSKRAGVLPCCITECARAFDEWNGCKNVTMKHQVSL